MSEPFETESGPAEPVVTTTTAPRPGTSASTRTRRVPPWNVVILNDEEHTFEYVIELLIKLFRHTVPTARALTWEIHTRGRAVVMTTHKELAELKRDQVLAYGPDPYMKISKGPLDCYIEPAE